jgi:diguanylate cyclase (GGDEF)-like protein/PAS domain S-box-containing protein
MRQSSATVLRRFLASLRSYLEVAADPVGEVALPAHAGRDLLRIRAALDASSDAIFLVDVATMQFADTNFAATRMLGYSREELLTMGPLDLSKQSRAKLQARYNALISTRAKIETVELRLTCKDRSRIPVELSRRPFRSDGKWHMICVARDISEAKRAVRKMTQLELRYQAMFDLNPLPMWVYDLQTLAFLAVNQAAVNQYGFTRGEFLAMTIKDIRPAEDLNRLVADVSNVNGDFDHAGLWRHRTKGGKTIDVEITSHQINFAGRAAKLVQAIDVTVRVAADAALRTSNERFELVARATNDIVWDWDLLTDKRWWNQNMTSLMGYNQMALAQGSAYWGIHPDDKERVVRGIRAAIASHATTWNDEYRFRRSDGRYLDIHDRGFVIRDAQDAPVRMIGAMVDITERKRAAAELTHHLTHDIVTGLPRFELIEEYLQLALAAAAGRAGRIVVLYVDIDYFHAVNETRGRAIGDEVLRVIARRLSAAVGAGGKVAHVAGDEFAVIQVDTNQVDTHGNPDQVDLGETVRAAIAEPMVIAEQQIYVTCSIGVSCFPDNATTPQDLLRQAEAAMMHSKRDGRNAVSAFSNDQSEELRVRLGLGSRLRIAIRDEKLQLHFQPQINGLDWQVLGFEALARWHDPELGVVMPKVFIQAAEELGLIVDLGRFVLVEACRQARAWIDAGAGDFSIAVNVSPLQLHRPDFAEDVRSALAKFKIPPGCIELELTESVMTENIERMIGSMQALKALGVRLALDDFGTGYSSLNYLRRFPIDCLKIDQSFVRDVTTDAGAAGICRAVITLAHQLGMKVMAEGVETAAQVGYLKRNECDLFQGYYFSKPVTADKALEMLRHRYLERDEIGDTQQLHRLLLVDDETNILNALNRALRRDGYRILTATCAEEALEILGREEIDVIVSDQRMPGMTGTELLSRVKEMYPDIVRIVLSGYTDLAAITNAINEGAIYKFLTKPWTDEELRTQIRDAFRMHAANISKRSRPDRERPTGGQPVPARTSAQARRAAKDVTL